MNAAAFNTPLAAEFNAELIAIADWWVTHAIDHEYGGFYGEISATNEPLKNASKSIILNTRILWFFSEVAAEINNPAYTACAKRAYDYLLNNFFDTNHKGVYWELDALGNPINNRKQVYAQAFTIYALCAYYQLTQDQNALAHALNCFHLLEEKARDHEHDGYREAFTREWGTISDLRLSEKDLNYPKTQNTHLHILEAYSSLYKIHPTAEIHAALKYNIELFDRYMIDKNNYHLRMFLDNHWNDFSTSFTYGHDIEASWLIAKAVEILNDAEITKKIIPLVMRIAHTTVTQAIGEQGHVIDCFDFASQQHNADIVWWVQAEAIVGFMNAYALSGEKKYLHAAERVWHFVKLHFIDRQHGEWLWFSSLDKKTEPPQYKVGFWKCPYHNGRAMIEAVRYLTKTNTQYFHQ